LATVLSIDKTKNAITTIIGDFNYDYLVIAIGCTTHFLGNEIINVKKYLKFVNKVRISACAQLKKPTAINKINEVFNILSISFSGNRNSHPNLFNLS